MGISNEKEKPPGTDVSNQLGSNIFFFGDSNSSGKNGDTSLPSYEDTRNALKFLENSSSEKVKRSKSIDKSKWSYDPPLGDFQELDSYRYSQLLLRDIKDDKFNVKKLCRQAYGVFLFDGENQNLIMFIHRICPFCHGLNKRYLKYGFEDGWIRIEGSKHAVCSNNNCGRKFCFVCLRTEKSINCTPPKKLCDHNTRCIPYHPRITPFSLFPPQTEKNENIWSCHSKNKKKKVTEDEVIEIEKDNEIFLEISSPEHLLKVFKQKSCRGEQGLEILRGLKKEESEEFLERRILLGNYENMIQKLEKEIEEREQQKVLRNEEEEEEEEEKRKKKEEEEEEEREGERENNIKELEIKNLDDDNKESDDDDDEIMISSENENNEFGKVEFDE